MSCTSNPKRLAGITVMILHAPAAVAAQRASDLQQQLHDHERLLQEADTKIKGTQRYHYPRGAGRGCPLWLGKSEEHQEYRISKTSPLFSYLQVQTT